jgi:ribosomal protein S27AE
MASMKRGVGYCENTDCEDYAKGVFLLNHGDTFYCPRCRQLGKVEKERGFYTGNTDIFKEVRVEYNFDPINSVYREIAIVRDESLWGRNNVDTLQSPLIKKVCTWYRPSLVYRFRFHLWR